MLRALRRSLASVFATATLLTTVPVGPATAQEGGMDLAAATRFTQHDAGQTVDHADVAAAMRRIGHDPGTRIDEGDERVLLDWANRARAVVDNALSQVGDPYRWGAAGPDAFDCSGLTLYTWRSGGASLPHSSRSQAGVTRSVGRDELIPGDLVFYGDPIHHVAVYIGDGAVVDAPRSGYDVKIDREMLQRRDLAKFGRVDF